MAAILFLGLCLGMAQRNHHLSQLRQASAQVRKCASAAMVSALRANCAATTLTVYVAWQNIKVSVSLGRLIGAQADSGGKDLPVDAGTGTVEPRTTSCGTKLRFCNCAGCSS